MYKNLTQIFILLFTVLFISIGFAGSVADGLITETVKNKLSNDPVLSKVILNIQTENGLVYLKGTVDSETEANTAAELAQSIDGVKDVNTSRLNVKSSKQPLTDSYITAKVKGKFIQKKVFTSSEVAAMSIKVETNNGIVLLSGTADNVDQINNAIEIARSVSGVKQVKSSVHLDAQSNKS